MSFLDVSEAPSRKNRGPAASAALAAPGLLVQRKCACGTHNAGGECEDCKRKQRGVLQRRDRGQPDPVLRLVAPGAGAGAGRSTFAHDFSGLTTSNLRAAPGVPALRTAPRIQRQPLPGASQETPTVSPTPAVTQAPGVTPAPAATPESTPEPSPQAAPESTPEAATEAPAAATPGRLIADDGATDLQSGQLRKSEFLDQLQTAVCAEAEAALAGTEHSTAGCPYLASWFGYYRGRSSEQVESALRRYAPEARNARTASDYIPIVAARVRQGVERWASTGELTGVPDGVPLGLPGGLGGLASGIGSLLFKAREGGARAADDPAAVQAELGSGRPLESGVRSRMESAFGRSFAHVRTHTDATASRLSSEQNSRAFTVGEHVAFAPREYRPGTMVGDALIAHELAHVVQQGGSTGTTQAKPSGGVTYGALERDADDAAAGAVASLWSGATRSRVATVRGGVPSLKSGLRLSRCDRRTSTGGTATKTVTINTSVLNGARDNAAADLRTSNNIFSGSNCGLRVAQGTSQNLNATQTSAILGSDNLLEEPSGATASTEEQQLVANNRTGGRLTAYYVPGFNPSKRGTSLQSPRHGVADSLLMGPSAAVDTFTHELGHILARDHTHNSDPDNLMASGTIRNVGVDRLTSNQCTAFLTTTSYPQ